MLEINIYNVVFVALLVWLLMVILDKIYYKPVGRIVNERNSKIENESSQIESMANEIGEKTEHIEKIVTDAKKESSGIKEALIKKGEEVRVQIITKARENSKKTFERHMKLLDEEIAAAGKKLEQEVEVFSNRIKDIFI